jgi:hypothetical protein
VDDALYLLDGDEFRPTELTRSPWHPAAQHGGPPAALAARAVESVAPRGTEVARFTAELLHEIPVVPLTVSARVDRPGRRVALARAEVRAEGEMVLAAAAWLIRRGSVELPAPADPPPGAPPIPEDLPDLDTSFREYPDFFGSAVDKRLIAGTLDGPGRAAMWFRLRVPLVSGCPESPVQRLVAIADSGNGISWTLPFDRFVFVNTDLSVSLVRAPGGEWFALDAVTRTDRSGRGITEAVLFDRQGWLGRSAQTLYVDEQQPR